MSEKHFLANTINELFSYIVDLTVKEVDKIAIDIDYETYDLIQGMIRVKDKWTKKMVG